MLSSIAGALILAAVAHTTTVHTGGYGTAHAVLTWTVAFGVAVGSHFAGRAWSSRKVGIAAAIILCGLAGEAFNFLKTADRLIEEIDKTQAPTRERAAAYARALADVERLKTVVASPPQTSKRLEDAQTAKAKADKDARDTSAEQFCRQNCKEVLLNTSAAAEREVEAARTALEKTKADAKTDLASAMKKLEGMDPPRSVSVLADTMNIKPSTLAIIIACLGSIGINGLAMFLLINGSHDHREPAPRRLDKWWARWREKRRNKAAPAPRPENVEPRPQNEDPQPPRIPARPRPKLAAATRQPLCDVIEFMSSGLDYRVGPELEVTEAFLGYRTFAQSRNLRATDVASFVEKLEAHCRDFGIRIREDGDRHFLVNVQLMPHDHNAVKSSE